MNKLIEKVLEWGIEKEITGPNGKGTKIAQTCKFLEEVTETVVAVLKNDTVEIKDGIGDTQVTLILLCEMHGWRIEDLVVEGIFNKLGFPPSRGKGQVAFVNQAAAEVLFAVILEDERSLRTEIRSTMNNLVRMSAYYGWTLQECLQAAYDVISKRSGTMVDGSFVKSSDMADPLDSGVVNCGSCS
jgi:hypothetical protein